MADAFTGLLLKRDDHHALASTAQPGALAAAEGALIIRYGICYLGKPHLAIVPGLVAIDYGTFLTGGEAWDFLLKRSNLYPRAEVFGYRSDGRDEQMWVRQLDLVLTPQVLVYRDEAQNVPLAQAHALIGPADAAPPRVRDYLPHYPTLADWPAEVDL